MSKTVVDRGLQWLGAVWFRPHVSSIQNIPRKRFSVIAGENYPLWKGTVVGIDLSLDKMEVFTSLLDHIRRIYTRTLWERRRARYRRPRFI